MRTVAVIPAAGKGKRLKSQVPKQYIKYKGKPVLAWTLEVFQKCPLIDEIVVAAEKSYLKKIRQIAEDYKIKKLINIVEGGKERQDSVYKALLSLNLGKSDLVAVHDAARPLLPMEILVEGIKTAKKKRSGVIAIKAKDTLVKGDKMIESYVHRDDVYYVQTPQIFRYTDLFYAMELAYRDHYKGTDESSLVKRAGYPVHLVEGSLLNFKITTADDLELFTRLVQVK
ncbi:MAG: 2-C-methyl-D-erythritol 4-phosphate cytidylyltransferase [Ignavibacteriales bacterium]|nr:MAG: 2-C-methyl-D-erythritol 4-phosphate cytidylyltransferase [Ignavibacteriales bacterium]